jgi:hypothetical protein
MVIVCYECLYFWIHAGKRDFSVGREHDLDSFLQPLIDELKTLATVGVPARTWMYSADRGHDTLQPFTLRAHLLSMLGDMPAVAKVRTILTVQALRDGP